MYDFHAKAREAYANRKPIKPVVDKLKPLPTIQKKTKFKDITDYKFESKGGHVEVYKGGEFQYSADTMQEANWIFYHEDF